MRKRHEMRRPKTGKKWISRLLAAAMLLATPQIPAQAGAAAQQEVMGQQAKAQGASPSNPAHHCTGKDDGTDISSWSCVCFGSYPQTEVTGDALTLAITVAAYDANGDAWVDGVKYRRVSKNDLDDDQYFGKNTYRYFKWEPIKWRVLQNDGSTLFVVADKGLDSKAYNEEETSITWEGCTLRSWLNESFYSTAFSSEEREAIVSQDVVNEDNPYAGTEGGNNTADKVYLLSIGETANPFYGFCEYNIHSASRYLKPSDYAHIARGVHISDAGNCTWWLRSPAHYASGAGMVEEDGDVRDMYVSSSGDAVVPALHIDLSSVRWSLADPICPQHNWFDGETIKSPTCTEKGEQEYICTVCGETKKEKLEKIPHTYKANVIRATTAQNGNITEKCTVCGNVKGSKTIPAAKSAALKTASYTYNGKAKKPSVTVKDSSGKAINNSNYTATYKNNVDVGKATVTIKLKGNYKGTLTETFTICPKGTSISGKVAAKSRGFTIKWKKQPKSTTGYQVQVSTDKKFAKRATVVKTVKRNATTKLTVNKLKPNKKYYVRIRTYKSVKGKEYCSGWSKAKSVITKR